MTANELFDENLKKLRKKNGLTLRDLGKEVCTTAAALSDYEKSKKTIGLERAVRIAEYFGVSLDEMVGLHNPKGTTPEQVVCALRVLLDAYPGGLDTMPESMKHFADQYTKLKAFEKSGTIPDDVAEAYFEKVRKDAAREAE